MISQIQMIIYAKNWHECLEKDLLCVIIGSYVQWGEKNLFSVSDDEIFTINCELFILEKRNAIF